MKRLFLEIAYGLFLWAILFGVLILCLAMPDILSWMSYYIGDVMTWIIFILFISFIIVICINKGR